MINKELEINNEKAIISKDLFRKIKRMNKDQLSQFLAKVTVNGFNEAVELVQNNKAFEPNIDRFLNEVETILNKELGIGSKRFDRVKDKIRESAEANSGSLNKEEIVYEVEAKK